MSMFAKRVLAVVSRIPKGSVMTYKNLFTISGILSTLLIIMFFIYAKKVSQYYYQKAV